jgi:Helicase conserved C-terminal domain
MENVVPSALQRLRAADIFRMAGLAAASLGQEYSRSGLVHSTRRQGARITGIVDVSGLNTHSLTPSSKDGDSVFPSSPTQFPVEVELLSSSSWNYACACGSQSITFCPHASALLYQWLAQPTSFLGSPSSLPPANELSVPDTQMTDSTKPARSVPSLPKTLARTAVPVGSLQEILGALSLSELRGIAREYELLTNGVSKPQLIEMIHSTLQQPDMVRRVATLLEKPQRQLLAALTLVGGAVSDEDLRGLFERFSLGAANQLQAILLALQNKAFLFRTSLNGSSQQRISLSGALLDIGWYVPVEVRAALHVSVPVTPFAVENTLADESAPTLEYTFPYSLLSDMLLVARTLEGVDTSKLEPWLQSSQHNERSPEHFPAARGTGSLTSDGSCALPTPVDMPPESLVSLVQAQVPHSPAYLRFVIRLLRLADLLQKDVSGANRLQAQPELASLLLGPDATHLAHTLFTLWFEHSSYAELSELQEENLRLRCRSTALQVPIIRPGELDAENSEARQALLTLLAQTPIGQWISFSSFAVFVYRLQPLFLQRRQRLYSSPHWWIEQESGRPLHPLQRNEWLRAEGYYLARLLSGPLHWWSLCDLARSSEGRLLAFRLTPLAAYFFEKELPSADLLPEEDTVKPAIEIVDSSSLLLSCSLQHWPLIEVMEQFSLPAGVRSGRLLYHLTPGALANALRQGHAPSRLLALLRSFSTDEAMSSTLEAMISQIERWSASYGQIRVYTGVTLLETADTLIMRELTATTSVEKQVVRSLQPTLQVLKKSGAERIVEELKRRGQAPLLHDEDFYGAE